MLQRGDAVPHFESVGHTGEPARYATIWQRSNLVLVALHGAGSESRRDYIAGLMARRPEFDSHNTVLVILPGSAPGLPPLGALVADKWGEIVHIATAADATGLPSPDDLLEWVEYVQTRCPECEGEAR